MLTSALSPNCRKTHYKNIFFEQLRVTNLQPPRKIVHSKTLTFSGHHTDRQTDRQTANVIPMSRNPSGARQKMVILTYFT